MKIIYTLTLLLTALNVVRSDKGCPYGWYLSDDKTTCYVDCFTSQLYFSNVYCSFLALKSANVTFDSSTNILSMPSGDTMGSFNTSSVPSCYNVTLQNDQYDVTSDGFIRIAPYLIEIPVKNVIKITSTNVTLCYPSSPQLLQCDPLKVLPGSYEIVNGTLLSVFNGNSTAFLGDFYVNEEAIAFFCAQSSPSVSFTQLPRCNMAVLQHADYNMNQDGSLTVHLANVTIKKPSYSINYSQHAIVCFPLSFNYLNCPVIKEIPEYHYKTFPNLTVVDQLFRSVHDPGDYYLTLDLQLKACVKRESLKAPLILAETLYDYLCLLSSLALISTIVLRFKLFNRNYHNRCLLCHLVSLIVTYLSSGLILFYEKVELVSCYCLFIGYYFFNMATFFWLSVIAFDSWQFFSRIRTVKPLCLKCDGCCVTLPENSLARFALYNAFCWGLAAILTAVPLYLDLVVSPFDFRFEIRPYVFPICYFTNTKSILWFVMFPLTATTMSNLIFLGLTVRILHRASLGTEMVNVRRRKQVFDISIKLFVITGLSWTVNCVCFGCGIYSGSAFQSWYWFMALVLFSLQGLVISVMYCAQIRALKVVCACPNN